MADILRNTPSLRIDNIISIHPELGPSVPDGGYGWVILLAVMFFEAIIPNLLLGLGICLMFSRLEHFSSVENSLSSNAPVLDDILIYAPIFFMVAKCLTEPPSRLLIKNSVWPRLVATSGTCLFSAGVFIIWIERVEHIYKTITLISGGFLCGIGFNLIMCQCDVIINQYFKLKLARVNLIRQFTSAIGFVSTPILLGNGIIKHGITHASLWYAVIILQGVVASILLKKPHYYNNQPKIYNLVERTNSLEDEYNIFDKTQAENQTNYQVVPSSNMEGQIGEGSTSAQIHENGGNNANIIKRDGWETFEDEDDEITVVEDPTKLKIANIPGSTKNKIGTDLDRIDLEENAENSPSPIFGPLQEEGNNNMYSFDDDLGLRQNSRSIYSQNSVLKNNTNSTYGFFLYPTFYKSLLQIITTRFSMFVFMIFFPSHILEQTEGMRPSSAVYLVGYVGIASMLYIMLKVRKTYLNSGERAVLLWFSCWIGCVGYIFLMAIKHESVMLIGGILIIISLNILTYIGEPLLLVSPKGETNKIHASLSTLCGLAFLIFLFINITFRSWFIIMAFMLFSTGCLWFVNFYYKKNVALY